MFQIIARPLSIAQKISKIDGMTGLCRALKINNSSSLVNYTNLHGTFKHNIVNNEKKNIDIIVT